LERRLISLIIEAEKVVEEEEKEQKEAEDMLDAKLSFIAAAKAAKHKICSIQVKPIPGSQSGRYHCILC